MGSPAKPTALPSPPPSVTKSDPTPVRYLIDQRSALLSAIRIWMTQRDAIVYTLLSGSNRANRIEVINLHTADKYVERANKAREAVLTLAAEMVDDNDTAAQAELISECVDELLESESPRFPLSVPEIRGSF